MDAYIRFTGPPTVLNNRYYDSINVLCKTTSKFILFPNISAGSILSNSNLILVDRRLNVCLCVCACVHACVFVCVCVCVCVCRVPVFQPSSLVEQSWEK